MCYSTPHLLWAQPYIWAHLSGYIPLLLVPPLPDALVPCGCGGLDPPGDPSSGNSAPGALFGTDSHGVRGLMGWGGATAGPLECQW